MSKLKKELKKFAVVRQAAALIRKVETSQDQRSRKKLATTEKILQLKDTRSGRRCFIVGNGPSLKLEDLNKMTGEDSFAVNRIYHIYNQTSWRPTYYFSQDSRIVEEIKSDLKTILKEHKYVFLNSSVGKEGRKLLKKNDNLYLFYLNTEDHFPALPNFSLVPGEQIYEGFTVAYACIQMAVYMGYREIYLIGTDHNYNFNKLHDGSFEKNEKVQNYMPGLEGKLVFAPQLEKTTLAYRKARRVCSEHGIVIKNATRGGKLEEFDRIDFDTLFPDESEDT